MKAMILAAGKGERLRPLTKNTPKPLIKVGDHALIEYQLMRLKQVGITDVVLNICYLAETIRRELGSGERYGVKLSYSFEPVCLGTGGGVKQALHLLGEAPFLLMSADIWSEYPFAKTFMEAKSDIHLLLTENPDFHPEGDYALSDDHHLLKTGKKYTYAGIAKINPIIFKTIAQENFSLSPLIDVAIEQHHATGELYQGPWFNVGTRAQLKALAQHLANKA